MPIPKLGVNIDHVATVREVRKTNEPDPVAAAVLAELGGADGITVHLREDLRHIQVRDVKVLRETIKTRLNLEMSVSDVVVNAAIKIKPSSACIVPESREEITTEGGLNIKDNFEMIKSVSDMLLKEGIAVSLFIDPTMESVKLAKRMGVPFVELHTGSYANALTEEDQMNELRKLAETCEWGNANGIKVNMGHGLTYKNIIPVLAVPNIHEFNIGHTIVSRAIMVGMKEAVKEMTDIIYKYAAV